MRKRLTALCLAVLLALTLAGCGEDRPVARAGTSQNEVLTLREVPEGKLLITMRVEDGMNAERIEAAVEGRFADVDLVMVPNTAALLDCAHNALQDLFCTSSSGTNRDRYASQMLDLSGQDFAGNYQLNALNECSMDGHLPFLPGPASIYGVVYDKDLFAENGWETPRSLDEFIALCGEIEAAGIRPLQPALRYTDAVRQFFAGFTYEPLFAGLDNYQWLMDYRASKVSMAGHIEPGLETMARLLDADILRPEDFEVQPKARSQMMYAEHACAMILETQMAPEYALTYSGDQAHEVGMMPFFSGGEGSDYLFSVPNFYIGANARLEEPGNEEKRAHVLDILSWLSSVEGQQAIIDPEAPMISCVKEVPLFNNEFLADVADTIDRGHVVPQPFWFGTSGSTVDGVFRKALSAWAQGGGTAEELIAQCDEARDNEAAARTETEHKRLGTAISDFTILETSLYLADLFQREMDADVGLCLSNTKTCGNNLRIYAGEILSGDPKGVDYHLSECFLTKSVKENADRQLLRVEMTGQQLLNALENPPEQTFYPNRYYAASGLEIEFAPWAEEGGRYVTVKLADGSELDPAAAYTVALWNGSVREEYLGAIQAVSEKTAAELFIADVQVKGEIAPPDDERFTLNWELT